MKKRWFVVGIALFLCGCSQGGTASEKEITPSTVIPRTTTELTSTQVPTEPMESTTQIYMDIDLEHFGSEAFCKFIRDNLDLDKDGRLSEAERQNVTELDLELEDSEERLAPIDGVVTGFSYFPNLKEIEVFSCIVYQMEICKHPSLERYIAAECVLHNLLIEDCPKLTQVLFSSAVSVNLSIQNCENLNIFETNDSTNDYLKFVNSPNVLVCPHSVSEIIMDASNFIGSGEYGLLSRILESDIKPEFDGNKLEYVVDETHVIWNGVKDDFLRLAMDMPLRIIKENDIDCFTYEVFEGNEPEYDEYGNRRYYICITTRGDERRKESLPIFLSTYPEIEKLSVRPCEVKDLVVYRYSPNNGAFFDTKMTYTLMYCDGENEIEVGTTGVKYLKWAVDGAGNVTWVE